MALPAQVRKQSEAVNKLYEELNADTAEQGQEAGAEQGAAEDTGAVREADSDEGQASAPKATEQPEGDKSEKTLEHKYKTLQGMYNAEVPGSTLRSGSLPTGFNSLSS